MMNWDIRESGDEKAIKTSSVGERDVGLDLIKRRWWT